MASTLISFLSNYDGSTVKEYFQSKIELPITVRHFPDNENLYLVYNDYNMALNLGTTAYSAFRSFVVAKCDNELTLVAYTRPNISIVKSSDFTLAEDDQFEEVYEGTAVTVFNYNNHWYFCTTRCTDIDKSYFNPNTSFGQMFDECLKETSREKFVKSLDSKLCYEFIIVHHMNMFLTDYTDLFGENYAKIFLTTMNDTSKEFFNWKQYIGPTYFDSEISKISIPPVVKYNPTDNVNSVLCIRNGVYMNIVNESYMKKLLRNLNYHNKYLCMLQVFLNNDKSFTVDQYLEEIKFNADLIINDNKVEWTGLFHLLYKQTGIVLTTLLNKLTDFDSENKTYKKINNELYHKIDTKEHTVLRRQIATLQNMYNKEMICTSGQITYHLMKKLNVNEFIQLLKSIQIMDRENIYKHNHTFYRRYCDELISLTSN